LLPAPSRGRPRRNSRAVLALALAAALSLCLWGGAAWADDAVRNLFLAEEGGRVVLTYDLEVPGLAAIAVVGLDDGGAN